MIIDLSSATFTEHGQVVDVAIQTPIVAGEAVELAKASRIFRKQVLKAGSINYKGQKLDFTPEYLDGLALAYREGAFDSVPLVFAPEDNKHTQDVERIRGEVIGFERDGDHLDALVRASNDRAAQLLRENPNIGVSVRIEQPIQRADGKAWPAAVQHVLATANPRVNGLGPWEPVDLAADDDRTVIDLSTLDFAEGEEPNESASEATEENKEASMADQDAPDLSGLTAEEIEQIKSLLSAINAEPEPEGETPDDAAMAQLFEDEAEAETEEEIEDVEAEKILAEAALSHDDGQSVELASQVEAQAIELAQLRTERDQANYERLRDRLTADLGIPPAITDLAKPLLTGTQTVELSNGESVDAREIVTTVMTELAKARLVDLSSETVFETSADARTKAEDQVRAQEMAAYAEQFGL